MALTQADIEIKKISGRLGIIQGLAWGIMSLICIILYNGKALTYNPKTYMESVGLQIYGLMLNNDEEMFKNQTLTGNVFSFFIWVHLLFSLFWIGESIYILRHNSSKAFTQWSHTTFLICVWDFITVVVLGADYKKCYDFVKDSPYAYAIASEGVCANALLVPLVIAGKGFVLWALNLVLALQMNKIAKRLKQEGV